MGKYVRNEAVNKTNKKTPNINHFSKLELKYSIFFYAGIISNYCALLF